MNATASATSTADPKQLVKEALLERDAEQAKAAAEKALTERATAAESKSAELERQVTELKSALDGKNKESDVLTVKMNDLDSIIKDFSEAGATGFTPAEIAAIDAAKNGEAAFSAKLAWIKKSASALKVRANRATELEGELAEAAKIVRENEIRTLFAEAVNDTEVLNALITKANELSDEDYEDWRDEKELILLSVSGAKKEVCEDPKKAKKLPPWMKEKTAKAAFRLLLEAKRSQGVQGETNLNGVNTGPGLDSGVTPNSPWHLSNGLRSPRFKLNASAAGENLAETLENVKVERGVNLSGASYAEGESNQENAVVAAFKALALKVTGSNEDKSDDADAEKPGFDPVRKNKESR